jgi:hypothetical protein
VQVFSPGHLSGLAGTGRGCTLVRRRPRAAGRDAASFYGRPHRRITGPREPDLARPAQAGAGRSAHDRQAFVVQPVAPGDPRRARAGGLPVGAVRRAVDEPDRLRDRSEGGRAGAQGGGQQAHGDRGAAGRVDAGGGDGRPEQHLRDRRPQVHHQPERRAGGQHRDGDRGRDRPLLRPQRERCGLRRRDRGAEPRAGRRAERRARAQRAGGGGAAGVGPGDPSVQPGAAARGQPRGDAGARRAVGARAADPVPRRWGAASGVGAADRACAAP